MSKTFFERTLRPVRQEARHDAARGAVIVAYADGALRLEAVASPYALELEAVIPSIEVDGNGLRVRETRAPVFVCSLDLDDPEAEWAEAPERVAAKIDAVLQHRLSQPEIVCRDGWSLDALLAVLGSIPVLEGTGRISLEVVAACESAWNKGSSVLSVLRRTARSCWCTCEAGRFT